MAKFVLLNCLRNEINTQFVAEIGEKIEKMTHLQKAENIFLDRKPHRFNCPKIENNPFVYIHGIAKLTAGKFFVAFSGEFLSALFP